MSTMTSPSSGSVRSSSFRWLVFANHKTFNFRGAFTRLPTSNVLFIFNIKLSNDFGFNFRLTYCQPACQPISSPTMTTDRCKWLDGRYYHWNGWVLVFFGLHLNFLGFYILMVVFPGRCQWMGNSWQLGAFHSKVAALIFWYSLYVAQFDKQWFITNVNYHWQSFSKLMEVTVNTMTNSQVSTYFSFIFQI